MDRWPAKPRKNDRCDAHVGWESDQLGAPRLIRCKNLAVETVKIKGFFFPVYFCAECVESVDGVIRNPKKKK